MKKLILLTATLFCVAQLFAQRSFNDSIASSRTKLTKNAMLTLGGWAAANIATGFIIAGKTEGEAKYFWRMNGYWNIVNLGLAGMGYAGTRKLQSATSLSANLKQQHKVEKLYLLNVGLDLVYITGAFYLKERGKSRPTQKQRDQLRGYGNSILLQGGFLLILDGVMYTLHHKNTLKVNKKLEQLELNAGPMGFSLVYKIGRSQ
jgi:hypothetical protein